jgi:feruloyl-CoA synthase
MSMAISSSAFMGALQRKGYGFDDGRDLQGEGCRVTAANSPTPVRRTRFGGCLEATVQQRPDGCTVLRSTEALAEYPLRLTDRLEQFAASAPSRVFAAERGPDSAWVTISYAQMLARAQAVGEALAQRPLSPERPVMILADNSLDHLVLSMGALWVGLPFAPISPAYALLSSDFGKLKHIVATLTPGLVVAADGAAYGRAIEACVGADTEVVLFKGTLAGRTATAWPEVLGTAPGAAAQAAHARVGPDTIAKFLFTSGSTKHPKAVVNTHRMWCANLQMIQQAFPFLRDTPPVLVDWLPWNHTFGGNHNIGIALYNGGTLYIDAGKPTPAGMAETLRNLREVSPTIYFNVPKGFEELARAMDTDTALREAVFARTEAFMYAGAGLSQAVWDHIDRHAVAALGHRIPMTTGLGMTETAPSCTFALGTDVRSGHIGLPVPGVEVKLAPADASGKREIRFRGANVMPGYWRNAAETATAFDDEGYYRTGDAAAFIDPAEPTRGLRFDGRVAEDFKLSSGTFVSVGPLRARVIAAGDPLVQDVVVTGIDRDEIGLMVFPRLDDARRLAGLSPSTAAPDVLRDAQVTGFFQDLLDRLWQAGTGSANRPARLLVLADPPSIDRGELTDKGSINQRAVLTARAELVSALYGEPASCGALLPRQPRQAG